MVHTRLPSACPQALLAIAKEFPGLKNTLFDEREQYMVHMIHEMAEKHPVTVAVVGAVHIRGIRKYWDQEIDIAKLTQMPR